MSKPLNIAETQIIRSPAAGPEPWNTLVFLRCLVLGLDVPISNDERTSHSVRFLTEFRPDGYAQSQYDWYQANTLVSAAAQLRFLNTTTDLTFEMAVESVAPFLQQLDGTLGFEVGLAAYFQDDSWFQGYEEIVFKASVTAYVLCYEPRAERPPSGGQRTPWAMAVSEGLSLTDMLRRREKG